MIPMNHQFDSIFFPLT